MAEAETCGKKTTNPKPSAQGRSWGEGIWGRWEWEWAHSGGFSSNSSPHGKTSGPGMLGLVSEPIPAPQQPHCGSHAYSTLWGG